MSEFTYVVIKHKLRNLNGLVAGVKFRDGYAVVKQNSKIYNTIKKMPLIKDTEDFPLIYLKNLKFITRALDVKLIYGRDVYNEYIKQILPIEQSEREQEEFKQHVEINKLCTYTTAQDKLCGMQAIPESIKGYCKRHILEDEEAVEKSGIKIPKMLTKQEKSEYREKVLYVLKK